MTEKREPDRAAVGWGPDWRAKGLLVLIGPADGVAKRSQAAQAWLRDAPLVRARVGPPRCLPALQPPADSHEPKALCWLYPKRSAVDGSLWPAA